MKTINFHKISAAGNDFILIDNRNKILPKDESLLAKKLCDRKFAVGADGLIILENSDKTDFKMRYYNSDGSIASMCGNGGRSIARFANILGIVQNKMTFETEAGFVKAEILGKEIKLFLYEPKDAKLDFTLRVDKREFSVSFINTGVPHTVIFVNDIDKTDVLELGRMVRYHKEFLPGGTNVNFVQKKDDNSIFVRTYERGVEGETLACGTGVIASAIIAGLRGMVNQPVHCITRGGYILTVAYSKNDKGDLLSPVSNVSLQGPAEVAFKGEVSI
ncbi:MAG: diaminopimelate epimerase [Elusimicrobia bacterium]|nr:diaminopimelate epimerase [Elusimicrobiota bacterium]